MQFIARWTRKFIGKYFPKPKFQPLIPNNLSVNAKKTLCFAQIPSQTAHLELFDINLEPIKEIKIFKLNEEMTKKYLNQRLVNFTDTLQELLNQTCQGLQVLFCEDNDFHPLKSQNFFHQLKLQSEIDSALSFYDEQNESEVKFDSTHSSIAIFSRKPSFISSSYQEVESNHKNDISIASEYYSGEFNENYFNFQDDQQFLDNNRIQQQQVVPRL
ncbi:hypothetical protein TTHERM_00035160 (macronuclear) [Tetrahymena thermophila SB210]|uniref:Uncharacterized protein n=1 Tax=Tetrahymena thermophila (strain SB210) TaxID=312017 RepID=Q22MK4_TETTS|nr:hypothetical protein TTHERM_00035160 [Tetrahymena thermophila SB210]EAR86289.2 hypothetical protein TTHERM_00035160 [Tetrahymena thermophila SB210]|eukprot:XP_977016.2 hypothetical protein TTHERM_00035160 [Tetrahymena thermophila SB210]